MALWVDVCHLEAQTRGVLRCQRCPGAVGGVPTLKLVQAYFGGSGVGGQHEFHPGSVENGNATHHGRRGCIGVIERHLLYIGGGGVKFAALGQDPVGRGHFERRALVNHALRCRRQGVNAYPGPSTFPVLRDVLGHAASQTHGWHPGQLSPVRARNLGRRHEHRAYASTGPRRIGGSIVVHAIVGGDLVTFWSFIGAGRRDGDVEHSGVIDGGHNGTTSGVKAFVDNVAQGFSWNHVVIPMHMGPSWVDHVDVRDDGCFTPRVAHNQVSDVADMQVFPVACHLGHLVDKQLSAWTRIVGETPAVGRVRHGGNQIPFPREFVEFFDLKGSSRRFTCQSVGAVPRQIDITW